MPNDSVSKQAHDGTFTKAARGILKIFAATQCSSSSVAVCVAGSATRVLFDPLPSILPGRHPTEPFRGRICRDHHEGICGARLASMARIGRVAVERICQHFTQRKAEERLTQGQQRYLSSSPATTHYNPSMIKCSASAHSCANATRNAFSANHMFHDCLSSLHNSPKAACARSSPWPRRSKAGRRKSPACGASPKTMASPKASTEK